MTDTTKPPIFNLYADAVAYICAGADIPFEATALGYNIPGHVHRLHAAIIAIHAAYSPSFEQGTERFAAMAAHRAAGGDMVYIEIDHGASHLGTVAVWLDKHGDSIKYEAVIISPMYD